LVTLSHASSQIAPSCPGQFNGLAHFGHFVAAHLQQLAEFARRQEIAWSAFQLFDHSGVFGDSVKIGLKVTLVTGEQVPALSGFRVNEKGEELILFDDSITQFDDPVAGRLEDYPVAPKERHETDQDDQSGEQKQNVTAPGQAVFAH
jgi:hypothetical protein